MPVTNDDNNTLDGRARVYARLQERGFKASEIQEMLGLKHVSSLHSLRQRAAEMGYIEEARQIEAQKDSKIEEHVRNIVEDCYEIMYMDMTRTKEVYNTPDKEGKLSHMGSLDKVTKALEHAGGSRKKADVQVDIHTDSKQGLLQEEAALRAELEKLKEQNATTH